MTVGSRNITGAGYMSGVRAKGDIVCTGAIMCNGHAVKTSSQETTSKFKLASLKKGQTTEIEDPFKNLIKVHRRDSGRYDIEKYGIVDARLSGDILIVFKN